MTCTLEKSFGFLKKICRIYFHGQLDENLTHFQCHNSSGIYINPNNMTGKISEYEEEVITFPLTHKCENDEKSYQACGFLSDISKTFRSFSNAICQWKVEESGEAVKVKFEPVKTNNTVILPTGQVSDKDLICNDICNTDNCEDESTCNGFIYGEFCRNDIGSLIYREPRDVCTRKHGEYNQCSNTEICDPKNTLEQNKCDKINGRWFPEEPLHDVIPVFNFTRCTPNTLCHNKADQFNCTDQSRVGVTCHVRNALSTLSKYLVCKESSDVFCDDGIDGECDRISSVCRVHKHSLCNGEVECQDGSDENIPICRSMTSQSCVRRGGNGTVSLPLPLLWLRDGIRDCINGEDEEEIWPTCGSGRFKRYVADNDSCSNVFLCRNKELGYVELENLCDGLETCGNENSVCKSSRRSTTITKTLQTRDKDINKTLSYCFKGLDSIWGLAHPCIKAHFSFPTDDVYGLTRPMITLPTVKTNCDHMFGEQYVYTSCTNKCTNSSCPLKKLPRYSSCPGQYPDRIGTIVNNDYLTFVFESKRSTESLFINNLFVCDDSIKCIPYSKVCDLVHDCYDGSDEQNCTNHFSCANTGSKIPLTGKCDGKIDCLDMTDECNDECSKQILDGMVLKVISWIVGLLAVLANMIIVISCVLSLTKCRTTVALTNKSLIIMISLGDLLVGLYLVTVSGYDGIVHGKDYCLNQTIWLTSSSCSVLGVISTIGSQLSLFAMTVLSLVRLCGIWNSMRIPGEITARSSLKVIGISHIILVLSTVVAVIPTLEKFEDFFINGLRYDEGLKLFIGPVNKDTHFRVFEKYFGRMKKRTLSWDLTGDMLSEMFSHDSGVPDYTKTQTKVGFYGNDGVCLFKYFIRDTDPQELFIWSILVLNFVCFVLISVCYIIISSVSTRSSRNVSANNDQSRQRNNRMNQKISIIISTDFLCWVPFMLICTLHYLELLDATPWYSFFSMIVLPLNSVINPLLYSDNISRFVAMFMSWGYNRLSSVTSTLKMRISPENAVQENVEMN